jgi:glycosyltransferase involved in cell wall biosynthesis
MKRPLNIALYYPWVYLKGGIERSMAALISRSEHNWTIFTSHYDRENTFEEFKNFRIQTIGHVSVKRDMVSVLLAAARIAVLKLPLRGFDAYVVWCDGLGPLTTFRNAALPTFCICSTPLRPVYDRIYAKEALRGRKTLAKIAYHSFKHAFRTVDRLAWKRFDGVVATSLEVKDRIVDHGLYPDNERMPLLYPGVAYDSNPPSTDYEPFFLIPGRISWTKNIQLGIDAFLKADLPAPWRLVIAGFVDAKSHLYLQELKTRARNHPRIEFVQCPSDEHLTDLYRRTSAVLFTPLNEDWGIVPLEGMMHAKPVLANNQGGPSESILPGFTGWLTHPNNVGIWAKVLTHISRQPDSVRVLGLQAREHAKMYDWGNFVTGIDTMIENTVYGAKPALAPQQPSMALST